MNTIIKRITKKADIDKEDFSLIFEDLLEEGKLDGLTEKIYSGQEFLLDVFREYYFDASGKRIFYRTIKEVLSEKGLGSDGFLKDLKEKYPVNFDTSNTLEEFLSGIVLKAPMTRFLRNFDTYEYYTDVANEYIGSHKFTVIDMFKEVLESSPETYNDLTEEEKDRLSKNDIDTSSWGEIISSYFRRHKNELGDEIIKFSQITLMDFLNKTCRYYIGKFIIDRKLHDEFNRLKS